MKRQAQRLFAPLAAGLLLTGLLVLTGCNQSGGETNPPRAVDSAPAVDPFAPTQGATQKLPTIKLWLGAEETRRRDGADRAAERTGDVTGRTWRKPKE